MLIIPAIDIREGACARVLGCDHAPAVYSDDPLEQAVLLRELGAEWVHITDLDGAFSGHLCNLRTIQELVEFSQLKVQHSGGCRSLEHIGTLLELGVERVVISASNLRNRQFAEAALEKYGERIVAGVDGRDGVVASEGFESSTATKVIKQLQELRDLGLQRFIYTDLRRSGSMRGPNYEGIAEVIATCGMRTSIAGGISNYESINRLKDLGVESVIIGKAIYAGAIDLTEALRMAAC